MQYLGDETTTKIREEIEKLEHLPSNYSLPTTILLCLKHLGDVLKENSSFQVSSGSMSKIEQITQAAASILQVRLMGLGPFAREENDENILLGISTKWIAGGPTGLPSKRNPLEN